MQAVERTLRVLSSVAAQSGPVTLGELADTTGLSLSTLHRYVHQLIDLGYLRLGPSKEISVGPRTMALGAAALGSDAMAPLVSSVLGGLSRSTGATSFVGQLVGNEVICTAMERGSNPLHLTVRIGQVIPVRSAASARAILAFTPSEALSSVWEQSGGKPGPELGAFERYLESIRDSGFDICDSELDDGVWAVAAPIRTKASNALYGSVAVAGPLSLFATEASRNLTIKQVIQASIDLSAPPI